MSKRKKSTKPEAPAPLADATIPPPAPPDTERPPEGAEAAAPDAAEAAAPDAAEAAAPDALHDTGENPPAPPLPDPDTTLDLRGDDLAAMMAGRDDLADELANGEHGHADAHDDEHDDEHADEHDDAAEDGRTQTLSEGETSASVVARAHLMGLLEALVFVSDRPIKTNELAKAASATLKETKALLAELKSDYATRGVQLDEVAGGWIFRTNPQYAPFVRDLTKQKPVRLSRAQVETLAILAYRQPITRPEIDEIRGVDCGAVLKLLLERDLVKILGKKDEPGRPLLYGTTGAFLEFFGLKSLKDLPTLREFTELNEDSRRVVEEELGDVLDAAQEAHVAASVPSAGVASASGEGELDGEIAGDHGEIAGDHALAGDDDEIAGDHALAGDDDARVLEAEMEFAATDPRIAVAPAAIDPSEGDESSEVAFAGNDAASEPAAVAEEDATAPKRVPGAWERAAEGDEDEEDDDEDWDEDEDEDDEDDEDEDDEVDESDEEGKKD